MATELENAIETYDSLNDTRDHINTVRGYIYHRVMNNLSLRAYYHDRTKLRSPEKEAYDEATPKLRQNTYGTPEYFAAFEPMKEAIRHHYAHNRHHPEHAVTYIKQDGTFDYDEAEVKDGTAISRMTLLDLIEMLVDWKAASERHADGDFMASLAINKERFGISDQLLSILHNTAVELGFDK